MMVAERSVFLWKKAGKFFEKIRSEYTSMSSEKQCEKRYRCKSKGSKARLILFSKNQMILF